MLRTGFLQVAAACIASVATMAWAQPGPAEPGFETLWVEQTDTVIYGGIGADELRVYAGGEDGTLRAFARSDGEAQWRFEAGAGIASAPTVDDRRVYFLARDGTARAVDKSSGEQLWSFATGGERRWDYWDYYLSTPAVDDRQVYFGSGDHHVYALDKRSGELRWKAKTGGIVHGEPAISGEKVIVGGFDGRMYAFDRGSGRILWTFKTVGNAYFRNGEIPGSAAVRDGRVYFGGRDYNVYALLEDTGTGAWNERTPSWVVGRPLAAGDDLFIVNSDGAGVFCYDAASGKRKWSYTNSYNMFAGAEPLGERYLAVASLDGRITLLDRENGSAAAVHETAASRENHPRLFSSDGKPDYSGVETLEDLTALYDLQLEQLGGISGRIVVSDEVIYYAAANGEVAAIRVTGRAAAKAD